MQGRDLSEKEQLPLVLLSARGGEEVQGITRLQKLVFLAQQGGLSDDPVPALELDETFDFEARQYGPFSQELYDIIDDLSSDGFIKEERATTSSGNTRQDYRPTETGREAAEDSELSGRDQDVLLGIKMLYNDTPLLKLINDVYSEYPKYAENTTLDLGSL
jgi:uncharacterized protein YwgA